MYFGVGKPCGVGKTNFVIQFIPFYHKNHYYILMDDGKRSILLLLCSCKKKITQLVTWQISSQIEYHLTIIALVVTSDDVRSLINNC